MIIVRVLFLVVVFLSAGLVYWTQTLARIYGYHPALGPALWEVRIWRGLVYPLYARGRRWCGSGTGGRAG